MQVASEGLAKHLRELFVGLGDDRAEPASHYRLDSPPGGPNRLLRDGRLIHEAPTQTGLVHQLICDCNRQVVDHTTDQVLLHASVADLDGAGVLLPAPPRAGKSTLVAGLAREGLAYVTDETAAVDPVGLQVTGYTKPLSLDPGSWAALPELRPTAGGSDSNQWKVSPTRLAGGWQQTTTARLLVLPRYAAGQTGARLETTGGAQLVCSLAECTFEFPRAGRRNLDVLTRLATRLPAYTLTNGSLKAACEAIIDLLDGDRGHSRMRPTTPG